MTKRVVRCWHRLPREAEDLHLWRYSRPGWMGTWAAWSSIKCGRLVALPFGGGGEGEGDWIFMILEGPFQPLAIL